MSAPAPQPSVLRSPIILGGLAVVAVVVVGALFIGIFGGGDDEGGGASSGSRTTKPAATAQTDDGERLTGKAKATINVRSDPGNEFQALGVLRKDTEVEIVAKSEDGEWLQIIYPPRSKLRGWVLAESLEISGDASVLGIATPEQMPMPDVPTSEAIETVEPEETSTPETLPTEEPPPPLESPTPMAAPPDLVISSAVVFGDALVVTVTNQGGGPLLDTNISVAVYDVSGQNLLYSTGSGPQTLSAGAAIDIKTDYNALEGPPQILIVIAAQGGTPESDESNNQYSVAISGG